MKKRALRQDTFREIKASIGRFLSILLIIAVGVGVFVGVKATAPSMKFSAETYFTENHLYDFQLRSTGGFGDGDVEEIRKIEDIDRVMSAYSQDVIYAENGTESVIKMMSLPGEGDDDINTPLITEGKLPENDDECLLLNSELFENKIHLGDTITVCEESERDSKNAILKYHTYKVTGLGEQPQYISYEYGSSTIGDGTIEGIALIPKSGFSGSRYTEIFLTLKCHSKGISSFDDAYEEEIEKVSEQLIALGLTQYQAFLDENEEKIISAETEFIQGKDEAERQIAQGRQELDDAEQRINEGQIELDESLAAYRLLYSKTSEELAAARSELDHAWKIYDDCVEEYQNALAEYEYQLAEYEAHKAEMTPEQRMVIEGILDETKNQLDISKAELESSLNQLNEKESEYSSAFNQAQQAFADAENQLEEGENQLNSAKNEYNEGLSQYEEAIRQTEVELKEGEDQLQNAKLELEKIADGKWYCLSREESMTGYKDFGDDAARIDAIANVFPIFFLLVAALVCMTTMSRMVDEQRMQLGTYKALGYKQGEIISKYLIYAAIAGICGCMLGPALFIAIIPRVIFNAYMLLYNLPAFDVIIPWNILCIASAVALVCTIIVALFASLKELRTPAAALMRPKTPKGGKAIMLEKIPFIWNRFSFFSKLTVRNLFRYQRRMLMTVTGIMGSMALIVAGFGLENAISPIVSLQYGELSHYDATIYLDRNQSSEKITAAFTALQNDQRVKDLAQIKQNEVKGANLDGTKVLDSTYCCVMIDGEKTEDFLVLRHPDTKALLTLNDEGAIITEKMANELNAGIGDEVIMKDGDEDYRIKVSGIAECYLNNHFYMTQAYYQKVTGSKAEYNAIYMKESETLKDYNAFSKEWQNNADSVVKIVFNAELEEKLSKMMSSLMKVVFVMIFCAGLLAFIVLYNLTNINISERIREIATVKVLGFNAKETNSYVFRENIIMCILGILVGCVAGYFLAQYIITTVEVSMVMFNREIKWTGYVYAAVITMLFTLLVNFVMSKKVRTISMVESLKAVE